MKRNNIYSFFLGALLLACFVFTSAIAADTDRELHYYQNLIGKTREYIEAVFPYYTQFKQFGNKYNNYYILDSAECDDGGSIVLLVGFDGKKQNSVVNDVSMFVQGCRDYVGNNDVYAACDLFSYMLGLSEYIEKAKLINEKDDGFVIVFPNSINAFGKIEKEKSYNEWKFYITGSFKPSVNK